MLRELRNLTALFVLAFLLLNLSCSDDRKCPTCPEPKEPEPGSYYVYIADMDRELPGYIYIADSKTESIIDSMITPDQEITILEISPDKRYLATLAIGVDSVFIFDLEINEKIAGLPVGRPYFSPDGAYLLIGSIHLDRLFKISTLDWSIIDSDTMIFFPGGLFNNSPILFGGTYREYYLYNYESMEIIKIDSMVQDNGQIPSVGSIITSPDDKYFYFTHIPNNVYKYEIETDSFVDSFYVIYGAYQGQLKNSPDGKYLLLTEVSEWWDLTTYPIGNLLIINPNSFSIDRRITTWNLDTEFPAGNLAPQQFDITPDGYKVICGNGMAAMPPVSFDLLDLRASTVAGFRQQASISDIAIGRQIE